MFCMHIPFQVSNNSEKEEYIQNMEFRYMTSFGVEHGTKISGETAPSFFRAKEAPLLS